MSLIHGKFKRNWERRARNSPFGIMKPIVVTFLLVFVNTNRAFSWAQTPNEDKIESLIEEAERATTSGNLLLAIKNYRQTLALSPNLPEVETNLGLVLYLSSEYSEAIDHFRNALRYKRDLFPANLFLGMALSKLGEADNAITPLRAALAQKPSNKDARQALCSAYSESSKPEVGVSRCFSVARDSPTNSEGWYGLGTSALRTAKHLVEEWAKGDPKSAYFYILKAESYRDQGKYGQAVLEYRKALRFAPRPPEGIHLAMGETLLVQGDIEGARDQFDSIPRNTEGLNFAWGMVQLALATKDYVSLGSWLHEIEKVNPGVLRDPPWFIAPSLEARSEKAAFEDLDSATLHNVLPEVYRNFLKQSLRRGIQGDWLVHQGVMAENPGHQEKRNPEDFHQRIKSNLTQLRMNWDFRACVDSRKSLNLESGTETTNLMDIAICEWGLGHLEGALRLTSHVLRSSPLSEKALFWKIKILLQISKWAFAQLGTIPSGSSRVHELLAEAYESRGNNAQAIEEYGLAVKFAPDNMAAYLSLGELQYRTGHFNEAAEIFREALARSPSDPDARFGLGRSFLKLNRPELAIDHLLRALRIRQDWPSAHEVLGQAYRQVGRYADAIVEFKRAVDSDHDGSIHYQLFQMYERVGKKDNADEALQESIQLRKQSQDERERALQKELNLSGNP